MKKNDAARGNTYVAANVLDKLAAITTREVEGVSDIMGIGTSALAGAAAGTAIGFVQGGPAGAAVGAAVGTAIGATAGYVARKRRQRTFARVGGPAVSVQVRITARYGTDLHRLAAEVRRNVKATIETTAGVNIERVDVTITDIDEPSPVTASPQ